MNDFELGDGWREVPNGWADAPEYVQHFDRELDRMRGWIRDKPVPPLPTEPYTVIRVTWKNPDQNFMHPVFMLIADDWCNAHGEMLDTERITGFEVLAEPRAAVTAEFVEKSLANVRRETAKAVLGYIRDTTGDDYFKTVVSEEFGMES